MMTVIVKYTMPAGPGREQVAAMLRTGAEQMFKGLPHLYSKQFCYDADTRKGLSVYLWDSRANAEAFFSEQFMETFQKSMNMPAKPEVEYHDTLVMVDNRAGDILDAASPRD